MAEILDQELFDYLAQIVPGATIKCARCEHDHLAITAIIRDEKFFCSDKCAEQATAILIKPQPRGVKLNGWDI